MKDRLTFDHPTAGTVTIIDREVEPRPLISMELDAVADIPVTHDDELDAVNYDVHVNEQRPRVLSVLQLLKARLASDGRHMLAGSLVIDATYANRHVARAQCRAARVLVPVVEAEARRHAATLASHTGTPHHPTEAPFRLARLLFRGVPEAEAVRRALAGEGGPDV